MIDDRIKMTKNDKKKTIDNYFPYFVNTNPYLILLSLK